jgi:hypothetical protein
VSKRLFILLALTAVVACSNEPTITSKGLAAIMPSSADAPPDTTLQVAQSGPKTLVEFVVDPDVRKKLESIGFKLGYVASYTTRNFPAELSTAPFGTKLYGAFAVLFRDAKGAEDAITFYRSRAATKAKNATPILATGLGKDSFAFRFSSLEDTPLPGIVYFWRIGNAVFEVVGAGNPGPDPEAVRSLAGTVNTRAVKPNA